jgi:hypothetical protein
MKFTRGLTLLLVLHIAACASGPKRRFTAKDPAPLKQVRTVAVIGFDVTQESTGGMLFDTNLAQKAAGSYTGKGTLQHDEYADQILESAIRDVEKQTGWRVIPIDTVARNPVYQAIYKKHMNNWLMGSKNDGGASGDLRYGRPRNFTRPPHHGFRDGHGSGPCSDHESLECRCGREPAS